MITLWTECHFLMPKTTKITITKKDSACEDTVICWCSASHDQLPLFYGKLSGGRKKGGRPLLFHDQWSECGLGIFSPKITEWEEEIASQIPKQIIIIHFGWDLLSRNTRIARIWKLFGRSSA
jgi:hypothetical protein